jgi:hypothetical protein
MTGTLSLEILEKHNIGHGLAVVPSGTTAATTSGQITDVPGSSSGPAAAVIGLAVNDSSAASSSGKVVGFEHFGQPEYRAVQTVALVAFCVGMWQVRRTPSEYKLQVSCDILSFFVLLLEFSSWAQSRSSL